MGDGKKNARVEVKPGSISMVMEEGSGFTGEQPDIFAVVQQIVGTRKVLAFSVVAICQPDAEDLAEANKVMPEDARCRAVCGCGDSGCEGAAQFSIGASMVVPHDDARVQESLGSILLDQVASIGELRSNANPDVGRAVSLVEKQIRDALGPNVNVRAIPLPGGGPQPSVPKGAVQINPKRLPDC